MNQKRLENGREIIPNTLGKTFHSANLDLVNFGEFSFISGKLDLDSTFV